MVKVKENEAVGLMASVQPLNLHGRLMRLNEQTLLSAGLVRRTFKQRHWGLSLMLSAESPTGASVGELLLLLLGMDVRGKRGGHPPRDGG